MTKQAAAAAAFVTAYVVGNWVSAKAGHGDSTTPEHIALQTRQDIGGIYSLLLLANGLLAAILAALVF
jgi:hypothetical protein